MTQFGGTTTWGCLDAQGQDTEPSSPVLSAGAGPWPGPYTVEDLEPVVPPGHVDAALEHGDAGGAAVGAHGGHCCPPGGRGDSSAALPLIIPCFSSAGFYHLSFAHSLFKPFSQPRCPAVPGHGMLEGNLLEKLWDTKGSYLFVSGQ